jgi:16S rRNA U1498 N3-methylase RsmE
MRLTPVACFIPQEVPWDMKKDTENYLKKFNHIASACRLNKEDELQVRSQRSQTFSRVSCIAV